LIFSREALQALKIKSQSAEPWLVNNNNRNYFSKISFFESTKSPDIRVYTYIPLGSLPAFPPEADPPMAENSTE